MSATLQMTAQEFIAAPEPQHGRPWNLIDGEVVVNDATITHARAQSSVLVALESWRREAPERGEAIGPIDIGIDHRNVFAPDVLWYREGPCPDPDPGPPYPMPDLAVEVRSPSTWRFDIGAKKAGYERHGLKELWLVDTSARTVLSYRRSRHDAPGFDIAREFDAAEQLTTPLLPGFALAVADIFDLA